jgi:hypothetical protein
MARLPEFRTLAAGEPCPCRGTVRNARGIAGYLRPDDACAVCAGQGTVLLAFHGWTCSPEVVSGGKAFAPDGHRAVRIGGIACGCDRTRWCGRCEGARVLWSERAPARTAPKLEKCDCVVSSWAVREQPASDPRRFSCVDTFEDLWADLGCGECKGRGYVEGRTAEPVGKTEEPQPIALTAVVRGGVPSGVKVVAMLEEVERLRAEGKDVVAIIGAREGVRVIPDGKLTVLPAPSYPEINEIEGEPLTTLEAVWSFAERLWQEKNPHGRALVDRVTRCKRWPSDVPRTLLVVELGDIRCEQLLSEHPRTGEVEAMIEEAWREVSDKIARGWKP